MTMGWHPRTPAPDSHLNDVPKGGWRPNTPVVAQLARNAQAQAQLTEEFGLCAEAEVAARARGCPWFGPARRWHGRERVFAVDVLGKTRYPGFQFDHAGRPRPVIDSVIEALDDRLTGWELARWFTGANDRLGGLHPVDVLDATDHVVAAARCLRAELLT